MMMERIELTTFLQQCEGIEYVLNSFEVPYQKINGTTLGKEIIRYVIMIPDDMAHNVIEKLSMILDTSQKDIYLTTQKVDATVSGYLDKLNEKVHKPKKIPLYEELIPITEPFVKFRKDLLIMIVIASVVALAGLYSDSPAIIIGAMLISPLLGPITAFSFNAAVGRPMQMLRSAFYGSLLIIAVVVSSALLTGILTHVSNLSVTHEIIVRTMASPTDVVIAILLGIAGGIAMVSSIPGILVGVAIAAALVPPATVTGIGIALLDWNIFSGSLLLTASNIIGLILGSIIVFLLRGVTPRKYYEKNKAKKYLIITILVFVGLSMILGTFSFMHLIK
jgi:uncharacterized hydrophobic protein (TIGR00341 family)